MSSPDVLVIEGGTVVTVDGQAVGSGPSTPPATWWCAVVASRASARALREVSDADGANAVRVDATGCLVTPGLVNTHHHLYQWVTRGLAVDAGLFEWLTRLYPVWSRIDEDITGAAAAAALGWLARTGCTTHDGSPLRLPDGRW